MDIFKVLSRSTKLSSKTSNKSICKSNLPSAETFVNPQLFSDATTESRGAKRKRETENIAEKTLLEDAVEVDFFASKVTASESRNKNARYPTAEQFNLMNYDQCRQILRSHRIKVGLLRSGNGSHVTPKKSSKKKKITKLEYEQIYPQPLIEFSDLRCIYGISNRMAENLEKQGYNIPTEIQMSSLPLLLRPDIAMRGLGDRIDSLSPNVLAIAPTGSGKTLAFLISVLDQILQRRRQINDKTVHILEAVVIVPTKELADQIVNEAKILSDGTGVKVVGMRKGMKIIDDGDRNDIGDESFKSTSSSEDEGPSDTENPLKKDIAIPITRADVLVSTPGLLLNSLSNSKTPSLITLPSVRTLVLDEADILLEPLFREQTLSIWSALTSPYLRATLWSATISSSIENLALSTIRYRRQHEHTFIRIVIGLKDSALPTICHKLTYCGTETGKLLALRNLLKAPSPNGTNIPKALCPPIIIFTQSIPRATALHAELLYDIPPQAGGSSRIAVLHSSLSNHARSDTLQRFRSGEVWVLITTDLLSRGVDFRGVNAVVNYDIPNDAAGYIHRVGRTGRGGRNGGIAVTFYTHDDVPYVRGVVNVIEASKKAARKAGENDDGNENAWLLEILPKLAKKEKKKLKVRGVEVRRETVLGNKKNNPEDKNKGTKILRPRSRISTKSGYERKLENRKRGAIEANKKRDKKEANSETELKRESHAAKDTDEIEWEGID